MIYLLLFGSAVGQSFFQTLGLAGRKHSVSSHLTFFLSAFSGHEVSATRFRNHVLAGAGAFDALGNTLSCFQLWHRFAPFRVCLFPVAADADRPLPVFTSLDWIVSDADISSEKFAGGFQNALVLQTFRDFVHQLEPFLRMRHFASFEHDGYFELVSFLQKLYAMRNFELIVMGVDVQTEFDFLDFLRLVVFFLILHFLLLLVAELSEVHDAADRGIASLGDHDQIKSGVFCLQAGRTEFHYAELFPIRRDNEQIGVSIGTVVVFQQLSDSRILLF